MLASLQEKTVLLKEIHHRVKNNLQMISSLLYLQESLVESASARAALQDSRNQVLSMALVHEDLYRSRDFSHIDFGGYIRWLVGRLLGAYRMSGVSFTAEVAESLFLGVNQAIPCGLIVNELCINVLRHAFPAGAECARRELHVGLSRGEDDRVALLVADTGVGMPPDIDPETATTLGMQIVSRLVRQLQGSLRVTRGDPGTRVEIEFPARPAPRRSREIRTRRGEHMKKARILVVEDEELVGLAIRNFLLEIDYDVPEVVSSGEKAVREVRALEPNLVLMDIHLAGEMDGIEAAGIIKDSSHVPVIFLTAYSDADTLQKAKLTEPFGYILKPLDERALEASIEMALHKAARQEELLRAKERLATVLHSIGDGIIVAGIKGNVEYVNGTAAESLHLTLPLPQSTSIVTLLKLVTHRSPREVSLPLDEVILNGKRAGYRNCILVTEHGTRRAVDLDLEPYRDELDIVRGIVLTFRDVAEPRRIEGLVEEELKAAVEVHKSLLPVSGTSLGGALMHGFLLPAAFGAGDVYNFYRIDETHAVSSSSTSWDTAWPRRRWRTW